MKLFPRKKESGPLREYLLGACGEEVAGEIERKMLTDDEAFAAALKEEELLIREYLDDSLDELDKMRFETSFLSSPKRRQRVEFERLIRGRKRVQRTKSWLTSVAVSAAALALAALGLSWRLFRQVEILERDRLVSLYKVRQGADTISFILHAALTRGHEKGQWLLIPSAARDIVLILELPTGPVGVWTARILSVEGEQVWGGVVNVQGRIGELRVAGETLQSGDYIMYLRRGEAPFASYVFRVVRR